MNLNEADPERSSFKKNVQDNLQTAEKFTSKDVPPVTMVASQTMETVAQYVYSCNTPTSSEQEHDFEPLVIANKSKTSSQRKFAVKFAESAIKIGCAFTRVFGNLFPSVLASRAYSKSQNLGQFWYKNGVPVLKFKSKDDNGNPTGTGYSFEDLFVIQCKKNGQKCLQVEAFKNGPDFLITDGEDCDQVLKPAQLKCCKTAERTAQSFYDKTGGLKYNKQVAVVPAEQVEEITEIFERKKSEYIDIPPKVIPGPTREQAEAYMNVGLPSFKMDAKNVELWKCPLFMGSIAGFAYFYYKYESGRKKGENSLFYILAALKAIGVGVLVCAGGVFLGCCDRQQYRVEADVTC